MCCDGVRGCEVGVLWWCEGIEVGGCGGVRGCEVGVL